MTPFGIESKSKGLRENQYLIEVVFKNGSLT